MAMISFFTAVVGVLALQAANAEVVPPTLPYSLSDYSNLISIPPFHTNCDIPWMGYLDVSTYQQMSSLAGLSRMRPGDFIQWYLHIQSICPSYKGMGLYESLASIYTSEMSARNIPYVPPFLACDPLSQTGPYTTPDPLTPPLSTPEDYGYRNLYSMLDRNMPSLSSANNARLIALLNTYLPVECREQNPLLANRIRTNMRYSLGMAMVMKGGVPGVGKIHRKSDPGLPLKEIHRLLLTKKRKNNPKKL